MLKTMTKVVVIIIPGKNTLKQTKPKQIGKNHSKLYNIIIALLHEKNFSSSLKRNLIYIQT